MAITLALLVLVLVGLLLVRVVLAGRPGRPPLDDEDVTDPSALPLHPERPIPGSSTRRAQDGKP